LPGGGPVQGPAALRDVGAGAVEHRARLAARSMKFSDTLLTLAIQFGTLSLMAFGGANAVLPEVHRQAVTLNHWMSDQDFAALFAIARPRPGPTSRSAP